MDRLLKLASPLIAAMLNVPPSVPPPGLLPMAMVIAAALVVTVLPRLSWTVTVTAGLTATEDSASLGCWLNASLFAAPGVMLKPVLVTVGRPLLAAVRV